MQLHADRRQRVVLDTTALPWTPSPAAGVWRRMLEREGDEVARATSIVRYEPGRSFAPHTHGLGEEFIVLEGCFIDEHGRYPRGTYVRNPPGSAHTPGTGDDGCTIFVKLRQLALDDQRRVVVDSLRAPWQPDPATGISALPLAGHGSERTFLLRAQAGARWQPADATCGIEVLVLEGEFADAQGNYGALTWLRSPHGMPAHTPTGCTLFVKTGHLP